MKFLYQPSCVHLSSISRSMARCLDRIISAATEGTPPAAKRETGRISAMTEIRSGPSAMGGQEKSPAYQM
jgi:hypothetical protein